MAKLVRPVGVFSRRSSARTWMTTAVEDIAQARPMTTAGIGLCPSNRAMPAMAAAHSVTCRLPRPNTRRRITHRRSNDSSNPIMNSSSATPSSAIGAIDSGSVMVMTDSHGK